MRIFLECTETVRYDARTGIQRVVRNIVGWATSLSGSDRECHAIILSDGSWAEIDLPQHWHRSGSAVEDAHREEPLRARLRRFAHAAYRNLRVFVATLLPFEPVWRFLFRPASEFGLSKLFDLGFRTLTLGRSRHGQTTAFAKRGNLDFRPGDVLVLLDAGWSTAGLFAAAAEAKQNGATVIAVFYDVLPLELPNAFDYEFQRVFGRWFNSVMTVCDGFLAISQSVQQAVLRLAESRAVRRREARSGHFQLGSDLDLTATMTRPIRPKLAAVFGSTPVFLTVGTLVPRKNHVLMLDAFDRLWADGHDVRLLIVGQDMDLTVGLADRILKHPQLSRRLFWFDDLSDGELRFSYERSRACVLASVNEGFGLPIVEALACGTAVLCSDIPVFREVAGEDAHYFAPTSLESLITTILETLQSPRKLSPRIGGLIGWQESTSQFLAAVENIVGMPR